MARPGRPTAPCTGPAPYPANSPGTQNDVLNRVRAGKSYGHPNPHRATPECVFKDGSHQSVATPGTYERPIAALRVSEADARDRHRGVSHHSLTAYGRVALVPAVLPVPSGRPDLMAQADDLALSSRAGHRVVEVGTDGVGDVLERCPVRLSTMGRGLADDRIAFVASAVAGRYAARSVRET